MTAIRYNPLIIALAIFLLPACVPAVVSYYKPSAPGARIVGSETPNIAVFELERGIGQRISIEKLRDSAQLYFGFYNIVRPFGRRKEVDVQWLSGDILIQWPDGQQDRYTMTWSDEDETTPAFVSQNQDLPDNTQLAPGPVVRLGPSTGHEFYRHRMKLERVGFESVTVVLPKARINDKVIDYPPVVFELVTRPMAIPVNGPGGI